MVEDKDLDAIVEQVSEFRHGSGLSEAGSVYESAEMEIWIIPVGCMMMK